MHTKDKTDKDNKEMGKGKLRRVALLAREAGMLGFDTYYQVPCISFLVLITVINI